LHPTSRKTGFPGGNDELRSPDRQELICASHHGDHALRRSLRGLMLQRMGLHCTVSEPADEMYLDD
jgi:hypothetical protein